MEQMIKKGEPQIKAGREIRNIIVKVKIMGMKTMK
jgi:hypothetical protein